MNEPHLTSLNFRHFRSLKKIFFNNVVFLLCNKVNQLYVYMYPFPLEPHSHPSRSSQNTELSSLCYAAASTTCLFYTWRCIYISTLVSGLFPPPFPPLCPQVHSVRLHLYSCPADRFISTIFLEGISFLMKISIS